MKRFFQLGAFVFGVLMMGQTFAIDSTATTQNRTQVMQSAPTDATGTTQDSMYNRTDASDLRYSSDARRGYRYYQNAGSTNAGGSYAYSGSEQGQPEDQCCAPADQSMNDCWCLYCHYEPCYYNDWKCVEDTKTCKKRCCRYVPQYYQVQKCRYVPQYYSETCCKQVPEYYDVEECVPCKKMGL